jgi:hypothetical protein
MTWPDTLFTTTLLFANVQSIHVHCPVDTDHTRTFPSLHPVITRSFAVRRHITSDACRMYASGRSDPVGDDILDCLDDLEAGTAARAGARITPWSSLWFELSMTTLLPPSLVWSALPLSSLATVVAVLKMLTDLSTPPEYTRYVSRSTHVTAPTCAREIRLSSTPAHTHARRNR